MFIKKIGDLIEEAFDYVYENHKYIWMIAFVFAIAGMIGFVFADNFGFLDEFLKKIVEKVEGKNTLELIIFIFVNNGFSALIGLFFGIVLGVVPLINALTNGVLIGYVLNRAYEISGMGEFWRLLPHGIFELPAIFIALGMGVKLGGFAFVKRSNLGKEFKKRIRKSILAFLFVVIPLLVIAAFIEGVLIGMLGN